MESILTFCLHNFLGIGYTIFEVSVSLILAAASVVVSVGILRSVTYLVKSLHSTSKLSADLSSIATSVHSSDLTAGPGPDSHVNIVPDDLNAFAFTLGWINPRVFLTSALVRDLGPDSLAIVIHHEMGHVARRDPLKYAILNSIAELLWFIPMVRHLIERARLSAELACDSIACSKGFSETDVARTLAAVAGAPVTQNSGPIPAFRSVQDHLEIRIRSLLGENPLALFRIPHKAILASSLIVPAILISLSIAGTIRIDPGGYITLVRDTSVACTEGHPAIDLFEQIGLECPHCGPATLSEEAQPPPPTCHTN